MKRPRRILFPPGKPSSGDLSDDEIGWLLVVILYVAIYLNSYASWLTGYY